MKMLESQDIARIAADLGLSVAEYDALKAAIQPIRDDGEVLLTEWQVERDINGEKIWKIAIGGILSVADELLVEFRFYLVIVDQELLRGSRSPEWFRVEGGGSILFEGEVEPPDDQDDAVGWGRYDTFSPIRLLAFDAAFARLATGRLIIESG
jgi:hypothetical protein